MIQFEVTATPSLNKLNGRWSKLNWKKKYHKEMHNYEVAYGLKTKKRMKVVYERFSSRLLDKTNYHGGIKPLEDAIKEKGMIVDDSIKWCEVIYKPQVKCKRGCEKTIVQILEAK